MYEFYFLPVSFLRSKSLVLSADIVSDNGIGALEDIACRSVVFLEFYYRSIVVMHLKVEDVSYICTAEFVYTLIIVSDHAEIAILSRE